MGILDEKADNHPHIDAWVRLPSRAGCFSACPNRARSGGQHRGTAVTHGQRTARRPLTDSPGQGPFTCGGCGI